MQTARGEREAVIRSAAEARVAELEAALRLSRAGDGNDDVLLRHADGRWHYYQMNGRRVLADSGRVLLSTNSVNWQAAIGDFNGDGRDDVLLRYSEYDSTIGPFDRWHYYRMDGRRVLSGSGRARLTRDVAWRIAGIADLNGDGKDDVLLRKTDGRWYFYPMDGRTVLPSRGTVRMTRDLAWQVMGIGHFDGDVRKSVLLRHPNGRWWYYRIQGRQELGPFAVDLPDDTSETVAGVGDLNGDGHTDVLAQRADGGTIPRGSLAPRATCRCAFGTDMKLSVSA